MTQPRLWDDELRRRCRDCGVEILLARNHKGNWQPFDPEPDPELGNFERIFDEDGEHFVWLPDQAAEMGRLRGEPLYTTHFDTCAEIERPDYEKPF